MKKARYMAHIMLTWCTHRSCNIVYELFWLFKISNATQSASSATAGLLVRNSYNTIFCM